MKHVGIAAVTAEGAALAYRRICATSSERLGRYRHPEISLHSFSFSEHIEAGPRPHEQWARLLLASAEKLRASGADFMVCPSNTPHEVYDEILQTLPFPWLHIANATRELAVQKGMRRVLLLGTRFTLEGTVYDYRRFSDNGIELLVPQEDEVQRVHGIITEELVQGDVCERTRTYFKDLISRYADQGVDGVILGCTELPLAIDTNNSRLPLVDSVVALADAAVEFALHD